MSGLVVVNTHPVQYQAPVYRSVQEEFGIPVTTIYGSDFSIRGYRDKDFDTSFAWDTELVSDADACVFLSQAPSFDRVRAKGLCAAVAAAKPRAVLVNGYRPRFHLWAILAARRQGVPILFRGETEDGPGTLNSFRSRLRDIFLRSLYARFSRLLPIGTRSYRHYRRLGCADDRLYSSPYCVDARTFQAGRDGREALRYPTRCELMIDQHQIAVLFSGKLITRKRPMHVIEAIGSLAESVRQRFVAVFLGDGPERMAVEAAARRLNVPARILGFQNQRMLSRYYHASDMLMLPSAHETWGLVVNEALHHGLPCVVSENVGCAPDLIRSGVTGEIVARDSASSYGLALTRVAERLEDASLPEKCRDQVGGHTVAKAAEGIALAYRSVI